MRKRKHSIFIISAPSGAGKTTLIELLLRKFPGLLFSISHTTRQPRPGETDGVEYYFVNRTVFEEMIESDEFLEWALVHGYYYGTSKQMLKIAEHEDKDLLLDIDVQGAAKVRNLLKDAVSVFILPPSYDTLRERLVQRGKDTSEQIDARMENAKNEIRHYHEYDYIIVNEELKSALEDLASILRSQWSKRENQEEKIRNILNSFNL